MHHGGWSCLLIWQVYAFCLCKLYVYLVNILDSLLIEHLLTKFSFSILVNTLCPLALFICYTCLCFVVKVVNKLRLWYKGTLKYLGESVTGMEFGLRKRWRFSDVSIVTRDSGDDACRCTDELQCFLCVVQ